MRWVHRELTVNQSPQVRLFTLRDQRFLENDLIDNNLDIGAAEGEEREKTRE
jgi:hypothetical protein